MWVGWQEDPAGVRGLCGSGGLRVCVECKRGTGEAWVGAVDADWVGGEAARRLRWRVASGVELWQGRGRTVPDDTRCRGRVAKGAPE